MAGHKLSSIYRPIKTYIRQQTPAIYFSPRSLPENYHDNSSIYMHNRAIDNLIKSGSFDSALKLFDEMHKRDTITWNIIISGHHRHGLPRKSLSLYSDMVSQGTIENPSTFSSILSICSNAGLYSEGLAVHSRVLVFGLSTNLYIGSALVDLYMKMGASDFALKLFSELPERNLACWNVVLRGFCESGRGTDMLSLYSEMELEGVEPNALTFCYVIQVCGHERLLDEGMQLHCSVIKKGLVESNLFVANALVDFYSACGSLIDARKSFRTIPIEDVISWNSMVSVCAANGFLLEAVAFYGRMHFWDKKPSTCTFLAFLKSCSANRNVIFGKVVHCCVLKRGFDISSVLVQSALIDMYGKCGDIDSSLAIFDNVPEKALECCNSLMTSLLQCGLAEDVIQLFSLMVDEKIEYDDVSLSSTLKALSVFSYASSATCKMLHSCAIKSGFESNIVVSSSLIDAYSRFGEIRFSWQVFNLLASPNVICFTSFISALARNGLGTECLAMLDSMIQKGMIPDKITFLSVLSGCNHSGLAEEGRLVFYSMRSIYGIEPEREHYSCMVDLLGRVGLIEEAEKLVYESPEFNDVLIWSSMLHSCRIHQNEQVGRRAAGKLMDLQPEDPAVWLQLANFHSEIGEFETATQLREVAMARTVIRDLGHSLISVRDYY